MRASATRQRVPRCTLEALTRSGRGQAKAICWTSPSRQCALRATVGEVSDALEKIWGRHRATTIRSVSGDVFRSAFEARCPGYRRDCKAELIEEFAARRRAPSAHA
jgi:methylmalonyl-CoA mutase